MREFFGRLFENFGKNLREVVSGRNLMWFGVAVVLTYVLVVSGGDWWWFLHTRSDVFRALIVPALLVSTFVPVVLPIWLLAIGRKTLGFVLGQAAFMGWMVSSILKFFTGRIPPDLTTPVGADISHGFQFGFLRGGIFWGWPSSHTTIAFAMAMALMALYPKNRVLHILAPLYALSIAVAVSISVHWLSEAVAGAIIGTIIGTVVGKNLKAQ